MNLLEIVTEELPREFHWTPQSYCSGTVEFYVNTAECASKYCDVIVYYDGKPCVHNGVTYFNRKFPLGRDVVLHCNSKSPVMGKYNIYWTNWFHQRDSNVLEFDERIVQSPYHQSIFGYNSRLVPLSVKTDGLIGGIKKDRTCLYSSSPDRGGKFLKSIWNEVARNTGARLTCTYSEHYSNEDMIRLYRESQFWLHPCQGIELFCIAGAKAQVAGCIPVVVPNMALATTIKYGVRTTIENYRQDLINAIENPPKVEPVDFGTWDSVTNELFKAVI